MQSKLKSQLQIVAISKRLKRSGKKIVFTNGCFDILHAGHVMYLAKARSFGDCLIIGLNSDASVQRLKGPSRPVNSERARAYVLSALQVVDYVVVFKEDTPLKLITKIKPNILVKGADWALNQIAGSTEVLSWAGTVRRIPMLKGFSTTRTIQRIAGKK